MVRVSELIKGPFPFRFARRLRCLLFIIITGILLRILKQKLGVFSDEVLILIRYCKNPILAHFRHLLVTAIFHLPFLVLTVDHPAPVDRHWFRKHSSRSFTKERGDTRVQSSFVSVGPQQNL
ncbi:hypothetical protein C8R47DRAFT_1102781 [Mycena vitilis]|nr:hypothetical protein C8R47DRAFT_1102781 [Mycena vitilis]